MLEKQLREQAALHERALSEAASAARQHESHERRSQAQLDQLKAKEIALQRSHSELSAANGKIEGLEARVRQFGAEKDDLAARLAKEHENETRELVRLVERAKEERDSVYRRNAGALIAAERLVHDLDKREELLFPQEAAGGGALRSRRGASGVAAPPPAARRRRRRHAQKEPPQQPRRRRPPARRSQRCVRPRRRRPLAARPAASACTRASPSLSSPCATRRWVARAHVPPAVDRTYSSTERRALRVVRVNRIRTRACSLCCKKAKKGRENTSYLAGEVVGFGALVGAVMSTEPK